MFINFSHSEVTTGSNYYLRHSDTAIDSSAHIGADRQPKNLKLTESASSIKLQFEKEINVTVWKKSESIFKINSHEDPSKFVFFYKACYLKQQCIIQEFHLTEIIYL